MSAPEVAILQARVAQLQALNRSYLDTMRGIGEEYDRQTAEFLQLHARVRDLEAISATHAARVAEPPAPLPSADKVLGCTRAQFLKGMEIIMRDTGKAFPEAFALWEIHARECEEERQAEGRTPAARGCGPISASGSLREGRRKRLSAPAVTGTAPRTTSSTWRGAASSASGSMRRSWRGWRRRRPLRRRSPRSP